MAGAVYWTGQDGNIWYKDSGGVSNKGPAGATVTRPDATGFYDPWADAQETPIRFNATQIADPATQTAVSAAPAGGGGTTGATLNRAAINNTQMTLDQLPALLQAALDAENTRYGNTVNDFNSQEQGQRKTYEGSTVTNQKNYDATFMDSIRAGIKGLGGLMALLRGTGASGGTVDDQVRDTVGGVTANDIRGGADTRNENQSTLDASLSDFLTQLGVKRKTNEDTRANNERAIRRDNATQMQDLFGKMAGYYGDAGMTDQANDFMGRAGSLTPDIAANSRTQVSPYDTTPVAVQAPQLTAFAAPTQPNVLAAPADGQVGSGIFTMTDRRRQRDPALAGA